jgi:hypothetical protein
MKTWCFEGYGVHSQSFKYELEITSAELAKEIGYFSRRSRSYD